MKIERVTKSVKDQQISFEESINSLGEALRIEIDSSKKKLIRDVKADIDIR